MPVRSLPILVCVCPLLLVLVFGWQTKMSLSKAGAAFSDMLGLLVLHHDAR